MKATQIFKQLIVCICLTLSTTVVSQESKLQTISWSFKGATTPDATYAPNRVGRDLTVSDLSLGSGVTISTTVYNDGWWHIFPASSSLQEAITNNAYFETSITSINNRYINFSTLDYALRSEVNGPTFFQFMYSTDGATYFPIGKVSNNGNIITDKGLTLNTIDLSTYESLRNIAPNQIIYLRLYAWGNKEPKHFGFGFSNSLDTPVLTINMISETSSTTYNLGEKISGWSFSTRNSSNMPQLAESTSKNSHIKAATLNLGEGLKLGSMNYGYACTVTKGSAYSSTLDEAVAKNEYFEFAIEPDAGYEMDLTGMQFLFSSRKNTPKKYQWAYSLDNGQNFSLVSSSANEMTNNDTNGYPYSVDLSSISSLKNCRKKVILRMYVFACDASSSNNTIFGYFRLYNTLNAGSPNDVIFMRGSVRPTESAIVNETLQTLGWSTYSLTSSNVTTNYELSPVRVPSDINVTDLKVGAGVTPSENPNEYKQVWFGKFPAMSSLEEAKINESYYEFSIQPKVGYYISLTDFDYSLFSSEKGPNTFVWEYSIDGTNFNPIMSPITSSDLLNDSISSTETSEIHRFGEEFPRIDLGQIEALQNLPSSTTVTFRLYAWGNTETGIFGLAFSSANDSHTLRLNSLVSFKPDFKTFDPKITGWEFSNIQSTNEDNERAASYLANGLAKAQLSNGSGTTKGALAYAWVVCKTGIANEGSWYFNQTLAEAKRDNDFIEITLEPEAGKKLSLSRIYYQTRATEFSRATSPNLYCWSYSTDGTNFTDLGDGTQKHKNVDSNGWCYDVDLSSEEAMHSITGPVVFRLHFYGAKVKTYSSSDPTSASTGFARQLRPRGTGSTNDCLYFRGKIEVNTANPSVTHNYLQAIQYGNTIQITYDQNEQSNICIYTVDGRLIHTQATELIDGATRIELPSLPQGAYISTIHTQSGAKASIKLLQYK